VPNDRLCVLLYIKCRDMQKVSTPAFEIPVPSGTVVKRKSNGLLLGDLTNKGQGLPEGVNGVNVLKCDFFDSNHVWKV
jgi:GTPase involved in cell partitioning and DNA repair